MSKNIKTFDCGCKFEQTPSGGYSWNIEHPNLNCPKVWTLLHNGLTGGIFQLDQMLGKIYSKKLKPNNIEEWADLISIIRPGTLEAKLDDKNMTMHYIDRKHGKEPVEFLHPDLEEILSPTQGTMVYQEQAISIGKKLANFTGDEADKLLRKGIGKKNSELITKAKVKFITGCKENGIEEELALKIFDSIEASQRYSFNKSHAVAYAIDGYLYSAYIKAHFPLEFYCTELDFAHNTIQHTQHEEIAAIIEDAMLLDIEVLPPNIRYLNDHFSILDGKILYGLNSIKHMGPDKFKKLKKWTQTKDPLDLLIVLSTINKTASHNLIISGACDFTKIPRSEMLVHLEILKELNPYQKEYCQETGSISIALSNIIKRGPSTKNKLAYNRKSIQKLESLLRKLTHPITPLVDTPRKIITWEKEVLGREFTFCPTNQIETEYNCKTLTDVKNLNVPIGKDKSFYIKAILRSIKELSTKKGELMARLELYDIQTVNSNIVVFPQVWDYYKEDLIDKEGEVVILKARMNNYEGEWGLIINEIIDE